MTSAPVETQSWSAQRWTLTIAIVLVFQAGLIFLLERPAPASPPRAVAGPMIHMTGLKSAAQFPVMDPTVFVLPHPKGFSGAAWLTLPARLTFEAPDWNEPFQAYPLPPESLGLKFGEFIAANPPPPFQSVASLEPQRYVPESYSIETVPARSSVRRDGGTADRDLLSSARLPAWPHTDLLTNSVVQVVVDANGGVANALLLHGSGKTEADHYALETARSARFKPLPDHARTGGPEDFAIGRLTFEWLTLPATNAAAPAP